MTVLPYVTVPLVWGLGSLSRREARLLFARVGAVVLLLRTLALLVLFLIPIACPDWESASFFSTTLLRPSEETKGSRGIPRPSRGGILMALGPIAFVVALL